MPQLSNNNLHADRPVWQPLAAALIERLRLHHAGRDHLIGEATSSPGLQADDADDTDKALDAMFNQFSRGISEADLTQIKPSRPIPARQILTAIRLAAAFETIDAFHAAQQARAFTLLTDVSIDVLDIVAQVLKGCFPRTDWTVLIPGTSDGAISKSSAAHFMATIESALDSVSPTLMVVPTGVKVPDYLLHADLPTVKFPAVTGEIIVAHIMAGELGDKLTPDGVFEEALPKDALLASLGTAHICTALRVSNLDGALKRLNSMTRPDREDVARLEDMPGDSAALLAARRMVHDLLLWKEGSVRWSALSRSVLFYGPPGTGKTYLAQAMGASAGIACVTGSFAEWQSGGHLGDMLREMQKTFAEARRQAPCILFIDEIDAIGSRTSGDRHGSNYRTQVIAGFLGEMNNLVSEEGVIIVGACNYLERLDPAILRAGRFDLKIEVPLPDAATILGLLRQQLHNDIAEHDLNQLSRACVGRSPAEIDAAIRAARSDARHQRTGLTLAMLQTTLKVGADEDRELLWRIAVHEAGHAVVSAVLGLGSVERITISDDGGLIYRRRSKNQSLLSDIENEIAYSLGGRAAERLIFSEISAGAGGPAHSDLASATRYAIDIEATYGLGLNGSVWHSKPDADHLSTPAVYDRVSRRIRCAEKRAAVILSGNLYFLDSLARRLIEKRSIQAAEIARILDGVGSEASAPVGDP